MANDATTWVKSSIGWLETKNYSANPTDTDSRYGGFCIVSGAPKYWSGSAWTAFTGAGATTFVALTDTPANYTAAGDMIAKVNTGATALEFVAPSGDVTMSATGVFAISADVIINADIKSDAAIAWSKMASAADISSTGTVTDLTITSEAQGDILYRNATNWVRLAAGTSGRFLQTQGAAADPQWAAVTTSLANGLSSPFSVEGGTYDPTTTVTTQTTGAAALTIPDLANIAQEWMFTKVAQTVLNKTFDDATCKFGDTADATKDLFFSLGTATTAKTMTIISAHTDDRSITLPDATDTLVGLATTDTLTNKTLTTPIIATTGAIVDAGGDEYVVFTEATTPVTYVGITSGDTGVAPQVRGAGETNTDLLLAGTGTGNVMISDGGDITARVLFELDGATTAKTMTLTHSHTDDRAITFPDATDTLVGKATTDTFTNKTIDCDGAGNAITNVNIDELDPIGDGAVGVTFMAQKTVANIAAAGTNILTTHKKLKVMDAWFVASSADSGTISVNVGQVGSVGTAITDVITVAAADKGISRAGTLDDSVWEVAEDGGLVAVGDAGASVDGTIFVLCMRVN